MVWSLEKKKNLSSLLGTERFLGRPADSLSYCTHYVTSDITLRHVCGILQQFMGPSLTSGQRSIDKELRLNVYHKITVLLTSVVTRATRIGTLV
jgi:hypothetical protein